jgi:hypothetical protein
VDPAGVPVYAAQVRPLTRPPQRRLARPLALTIAVAGALLAVWAGSVGAATSSVKTFQLPSHHIACTYTLLESPNDVPELLCELRQQNALYMPTVVGSPKPKICDGPAGGIWGGRVSLERTGKAVVYCPSDVGVEERNPPVLAYGSRWSHGGISCVSRTDGLHCNASGGKHGFVYSKEQLRVR